jgi:hypothetical protein
MRERRAFDINENNSPPRKNRLSEIIFPTKRPAI